MKILSGFLEAGEIRGRVVLGALEGGPTQSDRERGKKKKNTPALPCGINLSN